MLVFKQLCIFFKRAVPLGGKLLKMRSFNTVVKHSTHNSMAEGLNPIPLNCKNVCLLKQ
jgi:hypothetical protein